MTTYLHSGQLPLICAFAAGVFAGTWIETTPGDIAARTEIAAHSGVTACDVDGARTAEADAVPASAEPTSPVAAEPRVPVAAAPKAGIGAFFISQARAADARPSVAATDEPAAAALLAPSDYAGLASLSTEWIVEQRRTDAEIGDLFRRKAWYVPPPPPVRPAAPQTPEAPPLPFRYMGRLEESPDHVTYFLTKGERLIIAAVGDVIDGVYRMESVQEGQLTFTYLPLAIRQELEMGAIR